MRRLCSIGQGRLRASTRREQAFDNVDKPAPSSYTEKAFELPLGSGDLPIRWGRLSSQLLYLQRSTAMAGSDLRPIFALWQSSTHGRISAFVQRTISRITGEESHLAKILPQFFADTMLGPNKTYKKGLCTPVSLAAFAEA